MSISSSTTTAIFTFGSPASAASPADLPSPGTRFLILTYAVKVQLPEGGMWTPVTEGTSLETEA